MRISEMPCWLTSRRAAFKPATLHWGLVLLVTTSPLLGASVTHADQITDSAKIAALQQQVNVLEKTLLEMKTQCSLLSQTQSAHKLQQDKLSLTAKDQLTLHAGQSRLVLNSDGTITLTGVKFNVQTKQQMPISGSKIMNN